MSFCFVNYSSHFLVCQVFQYFSYPSSSSFCSISKLVLIHTSDFPFVVGLSSCYFVLLLSYFITVTMCDLLLLCFLIYYLIGPFAVFLLLYMWILLLVDCRVDQIDQKDTLLHRLLLNPNS